MAKTSLVAVRRRDTWVQTYARFNSFEEADAYAMRNYYGKRNVFKIIELPDSTKRV